jgi:hypothetical protein
MQVESMRRLLGYDFEWVLPGHGHRRHLPGAQMRESLRACLAWMQQQG